MRAWRRPLSRLTIIAAPIGTQAAVDCSTGNHTANLNSIQPPTSQTYSNAGYLKASNSAENDYTDLTNLTYVLNIVPNSIYEASVRSNCGMPDWFWCSV